MRTPFLLAAILVLVASPHAACAENWAQFRGSASGVIPDDARLASTWGPAENIAWKVKLPGVAWSQPIVWGDRVFLTTAVTDDQPRPDGARGRGGPGRDGQGRGRYDRRRPPDAAPPDADRPDSDGPEADRPNRPPGGRGGRGAEPPDATYRWLLMCLDVKTGDVLWEQLAHEGRPSISIHPTNTYASETPVTDGRHVFAYFGMTGLYCYDIDGHLVWHKQLGSYPMQLGWGTGSSPVLDGQRLYVQCDNEQRSFLVALDKQTGDELWRVPREERSTWATPYLWKNKLRTELACGGSTMTAYDPADGRMLWQLSGMRGRCAATPVSSDELLYLGVGGGQGGPGPLVAIRAGATGDITPADGSSTSDGVAWTVQRAGAQLASPLLYEGCLYVQRGGIVSCFDAATGEEHYRERIEGARNFTSSPWAHAGKIFLLDEAGQTTILAPGPQFKQLGANKLDDMFWSSVAVADDRLLLRGLDYLYCIAAP